MYNLVLKWQQTTNHVAIIYIEEEEKKTMTNRCNKGKQSQIQGLLIQVGNKTITIVTVVLHS